MHKSKNCLTCWLDLKTTLRTRPCLTHFDLFHFSAKSIWLNVLLFSAGKFSLKSNLKFNLCCFQQQLQLSSNLFQYCISKLRRGAYMNRLVGWSVGLWVCGSVCLQHEIRTKIQGKRNTVEHQVEN